MSSPVKCFCTPDSTHCPESGLKTCEPDVSHCLLSLTWNETANSHIEKLQDCWPWSDNNHEMTRCPEDPGVCPLMSNNTGYIICCCLGDYCNNTTNTNIIPWKESMTIMSPLPDSVERAPAIRPTPVTESVSTEFGDTKMVLLVAGPTLLLIVLIAVVVLLCYIQSNGFRLRQVRLGVDTHSNADQLTLFPGRNNWNRCLPLRNHMRSMQKVDGDTVGNIPWINQRDRPVTGQALPTDDEIEGLASLVKKISLKSQGCFGQVWLGNKVPHHETCEETSLEIRGKLARLPNDIAIKVFPSNHKTSWMAEVALFRLPGLPHPNILKFYGADKLPITSEDGLSGSLTTSLEYWLVAEYHPLGSIYDYIRENTIDWSCLLGIAVDIARGLSHLHFEAPTPTTATNNNNNGDVYTNDQSVSGTSPGTIGLASSVGMPAIVGSCWKPVIAHRDLNSRNILLKSDMTACIADFGLAIQFEPGHFPPLAHPKLGTRRYMAPEVLDGAIQFSRDAYLRIDVYAMGLVFWELMSRCVDSSIQPSACDTSLSVREPYRAPYELELGSNPTMEELQRLVALEKYRPKFDPITSEHSGMCFLRETVEECWDQDAEARLSAGCVVERLLLLTKHPTHVGRPLDLPGPTAPTATPPPTITTNGIADRVGDTSFNRRHFRSSARLTENMSSVPNVHYLRSNFIPPTPPTLSLTSSPLLEELHLRASSVELGETTEDHQHRPLIVPALSHSSIPSRRPIV